MTLVFLPSRIHSTLKIFAKAFTACPNHINWRTIHLQQKVEMPINRLWLVSSISEDCPVNLNVSVQRPQIEGRGLNARAKVQDSKHVITLLSCRLSGLSPATVPQLP